MDVSIILVSYNTKELTKDCLNSIYEKTSGMSFDVWVVDNASKDGSVEMIQQEFPQINLIASDENLGFGRANNLALNKINSKYVFLLNTDTLLLNNAVKILFDFMEKPENADIGATGGQLFNQDMTYQNSVGDFYNIDQLSKKAFGINFHKTFYRLDDIFDKTFKNQQCYEHTVANNVGREVDYIIGADLMMRKSVLDETGLFNEKFFMFAEEAELQFRIKKTHRIIFNPEAKILHYGRASSNNANKQLQVEKMIFNGIMLFYSLCYGIEIAKKARNLYIIYYLRYFILRFFSPKMFKRLKMVLDFKFDESESY